MYPVRLNDDGTLEDVFKPAIYLDTNVLNYYFLYEGAEDLVDDRPEVNNQNNNDNHELPEPREHMVIRDIVKSKSYLQDYANIRYIATYGLSRASLIMTPISFLELYKIHAEISFKEFMVDAIGVKRVQVMREKEVGQYLSEIFRRYLDDKRDTALNNIVQSTVFNWSFAHAHGLQGIFYISKLNLTLNEADIVKFLWMLSYFQLDTVDILHLHAAKLLNCDYFGTHDKGFLRNSKIIEEASGIRIVSTKEIIKVLNDNRKDAEQ